MINSVLASLSGATIKTEKIFTIFFQSLEYIMIKKRLIFAILLFILWGSQAAKSDKSTSPARWKCRLYQSFENNKRTVLINFNSLVFRW